MNFASPYTYFNKREKPQQEKKSLILRKEARGMVDEDELFQTDVNVMSIGFAFLKEAQKNMGTGDAVFCSGCQTALSSFSKLMDKEVYLQKVQSSKPQKMEIEEEKKAEVKKLEPLGKIKQEFEEIKPNEKIWICEFCEKQNKFMIEDEEIPKKDDMIYIIESKNKEKKLDQESDISIILCIDNSGSMSITSEVKGKMNLKHGLTEEEYNMIKDFIEPGAERYQFLPSQNRNTSWVSRKQCVLAAIETQLNEMKTTHPNRKVGLVTFNSDVTLIGDGKGEPKFIAGDKLFQYKEIVETAQTNHELLMKEPLKNSSETLVNQFNKIEEGGKTSLGPALLASVALAAKGKPGSMVVICTDGLANVGLGSLDQECEIQESNKFYEEVTKLAVDSNIIISVITIKGEGCKIETLGKLAESTNGNVTRVNPEDISKDFSGILKDEIVATDVTLEIRLHKGLKFCNEDKANLNEDGSLLKTKVGNATVKTEIAFQYEVKPDEELKKLNINIEEALEVPFQAQIHYTTPEGHKFMRVITQVQKLTKNKDLAEKMADAKILHFNAAQKASYWARGGNYEMSRKYNKNWSNYLHSNENMNSKPENVEINEMMQKHHKHLRGAISKKEKKIEKEFGLNLDSDSDEEERQKGKSKEIEEKEEKSNLTKDNLKHLSGVKEEREEEEHKPLKKKKKKRQLSCSSGSENLVHSDDEGEAAMIQMKKGLI